LICANAQSIVISRSTAAAQRSGCHSAALVVASMVQIPSLRTEVIGLELPASSLAPSSLALPPPANIELSPVLDTSRINIA